MNTKLLELFKLPEAELTSNYEIIQKKKILKRIYLDFYMEFKNSLIDLPEGKLVEIGSGSGFLKEVIPGVITSDINSLLNVDSVFPATKMPFENNSVSVFFLLDVLHHIDNPRDFFNEASRCLVDGSRIVMIEPFNSLWSRLIYAFHHEPFNLNVSWEVNQGNYGLDANIALPWLIFFRDRKKFEKMFPMLKIKRLTPHTPFLYLISGGLSYKQLLPSSAYNLVKWIEVILSPLNKYLGMFVTIELEKDK